MNRSPASLVLAMREVITCVDAGGSPFGGGPVQEDTLATLALLFAREIIHEEFYQGLEARFTRGEDPQEFMVNYLAIVFAQGVSTGIRFTETEK
jgi:hypothetical protein